MMRSYIRRWLDRFTSLQRPSRPRQSARRRARLHVEALERREVPAISISDAVVTEGNFNPDGQTGGLPSVANFTVTLSQALPNPVTVDFATANGTAGGVRVVRVASGLARPVAVATAPGDDNRLFIAEQFAGNQGRIRILDRGTGQVQDPANAFLTFGPVSTGNEQGLLGLTFDPNFQTNGFFYVNFTTNSPPPGVPTGPAGATVIRRYQVSAANPNQADPASATTILGFAQPETNHNGGWLEFGPDGFLYISSGDGGGANDQHPPPGVGSGQSLDTLLGKILRIDVNGDDFPGDDARNYRIPPSNPFAGATPGLDEIWSWGLRNPFRAGFDRLTGDLYIGDVGQNQREEINFQSASSPGGENWGWRTWEGTIRTPGITTPLPDPSQLFPILELPHTGPNGSVAIIGGYVYRGPIAELQGMYFFGESNLQRVWTARYNGTTPFTGANFSNFARWSDASTAVPDLLIPDRDGAVDPIIGPVASFGQDSAGNLFIVDLFGGEVFQIVEGGDFARVRGTLTIPAGQTTAVISMQIVGDTLDEPNEFFFINLSNAQGDTIADGQGQGTILDDDGVTSQRVTALTPTETGFVIQFNWPVETGAVNLIDTQAGTLGPADVVLTGPGGVTVNGSLVFDVTRTRATFVHTGGVLPRGAYTVTLRSAANGFKSSQTDELLDGDGDGTPGGDFATNFSLTSAALSVGIPDFARGPSQPVNVPAAATGLPLTISNSAGVTSVSLELRYNPLLLNITAASAVPPGTTVALNLATPGVARILFSSPSPLPEGITELVRLTASVPASAASFYTEKHVLDLFNVQVNGAAAIDDDGVHVVAFLGDTTGNGTYTSLDAQRALRVAVGLDGGFEQFQLLDPLILADVTGNGIINATDATRILQEVVGLDQPEIPPLPPGPPPVTPTGPDPLLSIPTDLTARRGQFITVPVDLDLSDGLQSAEIALAYDTSRLELVSEADVRRGSLTADFGLFAVNTNLGKGEGRVLAVLSRFGPISGRGSGSVIEITFRVRDDAPPGPAFINLLENIGSTATALNEGGLVLQPAPSNESGDALDGVVAVQDEPLPRIDQVTINDGQTQRSQVTSATVTFSTVVRFLSDPAAAFQLLGSRGPVRLNVVLGLDDSGTRTVARLTFDGRGVLGNGSLANGKYVLTVNGDRVVDASGRAIDADEDGTPGGVDQLAFFRLFGDGDSDGDVDRADLAAL